MYSSLDYPAGGSFAGAPSGSDSGRGWLRSALLALSGCVLWALLTLPRFFGDSTMIAKQVRGYDALHDGDMGEMWDFGHLLWRFAGDALFHAAKPLWVLFEDPGSFQAYYLPLLVMAWVGTGVALFATLRLIGRFDSSWTTALTATATYLSINAVTNYLQAGSSYPVGLAFLSLAVMMIHAPEGGRAAKPVWVGLMLALSAGFWFPYVVVFPAVLLTPVFLPAEKDAGARARGWNMAIRTGIYTALFTAAIYAIPIIQMRLFSFHQLIEWFRLSSHGWAQNKRYIRFVFGFPASFFYQASEGILFKRYLLHDPYAPVTLADLAGASLGKIVVFFGYLGLLLFSLYRSPNRNLLLWAGFAIASEIGFAIFVFEPSSIERYLPLLPFLFAGVVVACRDRRMRWVTGAFVVLLVGNNMVGHWRPSAMAVYDRVEARSQAISSRLTPNDLEFVVTQDDDLDSLATGYPFHPFNRNARLHTTAMVSIAIKDIVVWRENFGRLTTDVWSKNGNVWLCKRLLADRPKPEWRWAEGDDPHIHWKDFSAFFSQFELGEGVGGDDGFLLFPRTEKNLGLIQSLAAQWRPVY